MVKISIVIPIYNAEKFIINLLNNIYEQTFSDFEVICIDDGSNDNTKSILEEFAKTKTNILIISQENAGIGKATNRGIFKANGEYIFQIDHDDSLVRNDAFDILYTTAKKYDLDVLSFNSMTENEKTILKQPSNLLMTGKDYLLGGYIPSFWSKFWKRDYLEKINFKFNEKLRFVDTESYPRLMIDAKKVMHIEDVLYLFQLDTNRSSVSKTIMNYESAVAFVETSFTYEKLINQSEKNDKLLKALKRERIKNTISAVRILGSIDTIESKKLYSKIICLGFTSFEKILVENEYKFFYYRNVKGRKKFLHPIVYLIRKLRKSLI